MEKLKIEPKNVMHINRQEREALHYIIAEMQKLADGNEWVLSEMDEIIKTSNRYA